MSRMHWIALRVIHAVLKRPLGGRSPWEWHHHQMTGNPPYARILIQGVVRALWQDSVDLAAVVLAKTVTDLARYLKRGDDAIE